MPHHVTVPDLGAKIELLLRSDKTPIKTNKHLMEKLDIQADYLSRLKMGARMLTEEKFVQLSALFNVQQKVWFNELEEFGERLGFSRKEIAIIAGRPLPGIDFDSRIKDKQIIGDLFNVIGGYWESFYFSVSKSKKALVSRDLLVVRRINEDGYIECEIKDSYFTYKGWCFPIRNHLYFVLEKDKLYNEIIVYATNLPDRQPPRLYGVILCLSGGVEETRTCPCAAKVAFRFLGDPSEASKQFSKPEKELDSFLVKEIPKYIDPSDPKIDKDTKQIIKDIRNDIKNDAVPLALRMDK